MILLFVPIWEILKGRLISPLAVHNAGPRSSSRRSPRPPRGSRGQLCDLEQLQSSFSILDHKVTSLFKLTQLQFFETTCAMSLNEIQGKLALITGASGG